MVTRFVKQMGYYHQEYVKRLQYKWEMSHVARRLCHVDCFIAGKRIIAGVETSPVNKFSSISANSTNTVLSRDVGLRRIASVKCCPLYYAPRSLSRTIRHSLDKSKGFWAIGVTPAGFL